MSDMVAENPFIEGEAPRKRGRPHRTPDEVKQHVDEAFTDAAARFNSHSDLVRVVVSVKPSEAWRCPWVDGRITQPREELMVPRELAEDMQRNELVIILKGGS
jgi:hypothetical protein